MTKKDYIPDSDQEKAALFERFRDTIGTYSLVVGVTTAEKADQARDATWYRYVLNNALIVRDSAVQWTSYKNLILSGPSDGNIPATPVTTPPASPPPASAPPDVLGRFRELARRIKASSGYTDAIGEALGIVGPDHAPRNFGTLAPLISLRTSGDAVEVVWNKDGMEAVEIQKDSGSGWTFLAVDTRPNYTDTTPAPATASRWKYRAIYTHDSEKVGQWSNVAEITVGG